MQQRVDMSLVLGVRVSLGVSGYGYYSGIGIDLWKRCDKKDELNL
jgi:hypothetical protein